MAHTPQFTPGPWERLEGSSVVCGVNDPERYKGFRVAVARCGDEIAPSGGLKYGPERDANAQLISSAPQGYELAKIVLAREEWERTGEDESGDIPGWAAIVAKARELMNKAEGK